jgi:hypothetical protein
MNKFRKILLGAGMLTLAVAFVAVGVADATLTLGATSVTSDGNVTINGITTSVYAIGAATTSGTITVGGTSQTGAITIGQSTAANTISIGDGINADVQAITIGNGASAANTSVSILSGVGTAGAGTLALGNNTRVTTIGIGNIAPAAARTTTIAGGNSGQNDTVTIFPGNPSANTQTFSVFAGTATGGNQTVNLVSGTGGTKLINIGTGNVVNTIHIGDDATPANAITIGGAASTTTVGGTFAVTTPTRLEYRLSSTSVNVGAVATTALYTVPAAKTAVITRVVVRSASGTFNQVVDPIFNIGWQAVASNVVNTATYVTPTASTTYIQPTVLAEATMGAAAEVLNFNVTTAASASTTATVDIFGYLF